MPKAIFVFWKKSLYEKISLQDQICNTVFTRSRHYFSAFSKKPFLRKYRWKATFMKNYLPSCKETDCGEMIFICENIIKETFNK